MPGARRDKVRPTGSHDCWIAKKLAQHTPSSGISAKNSPSTPENADFEPFFVRWANFFALAPSPGQAGRTFSRTGHGHVPTLKPMTPLQPLMQASMKPLTPLQPKNARNTASFRPQRRCGFNPTRVRASKGDAGFRRAGRLVYRTQMRYPWPAAGPGRATSGRPTLQTSSNQHDSNRLARTSVTNVVNLSPKTSIFTEKAIELTTFVTPGQKSTQKTPWIDDVCNNTHRATRQHTRHHRCGGRRRVRRARAGFEARRRTK